MSGQQWGYTADNGKLNYILLLFKKKIIRKIRQTIYREREFKACEMKVKGIAVSLFRLVSV